MSRVGHSGAGTAGDDDPLAEEEEVEAAYATPTSAHDRPRSFRGQLQHLEQAMTHRLDLMDARLDEQHTMLAQILSLLQLQHHPPSS